MTAMRTGSAITAMWAWDNPVDPAQDPRGRGYAPATPERLAAFARAGRLREVYLLAPSGPAGGAIDAWTADAVAALQDDGVRVSAVTGVSGASARWTEAALGVAPFDRLQVLVLPWAAPAPGRSADDVATALGAALTAVRGAAGDLPVDAGLPWWLAACDGPTEGAASPTVASGDVGSGDDTSGDVASGDDASAARALDAVLPHADRVLLAAPAGHAHGAGGILELAGPAVAALSSSGRPFTVAVQTDAPDIAGGADRTFFDEGPVALIRECALVGQALADVPGFEGVAVKSHRAWRRLLGV
jgi:hypothetical protein